MTTALDRLWEKATPSQSVFDPACLRTKPEPVRRYLEHAIAPGSPLASAVRLRMHGEFRQREWYPFTAEQVIRDEGEMLWQATVRMHGLPVTGADSLLDGKGRMQWRLLGILPLVTAAGPEITRSSIGRVEGERIWLPSAFCLEPVEWSVVETRQVHARLNLLSEGTEIALTLTPFGGIETLQYPRWGNPEGEAFHYENFGGIVEEEGTFEGYTIPTRLRIGWHIGTDRFASEGEFFRVTIDEARFR